jgi:hypothetical protein
MDILWIFSAHWHLVCELHSVCVCVYMCDCDWLNPSQSPSQWHTIRAWLQIGHFNRRRQYSRSLSLLSSTTSSLAFLLYPRSLPWPHVCHHTMLSSKCFRLFPQFDSVAKILSLLLHMWERLTSPTFRSTIMTQSRLIL